MYSKPMSREDYTKNRLHDPKLPRSAPNDPVALGAFGAGLVGGTALTGIAKYALAAAPRPIQMLGMGAALIGGTLGTMYGIGKAHAALTN